MEPVGKARREPNEVEAFLAAHFAKSSPFGVAGAARRKAIRSIGEAAEKAWRWLWIKRSHLSTDAAGTQVRVWRVEVVERPKTPNDDVSQRGLRVKISVIICS